MEWISGNIFIRPNENLPKGSIVQGHKHNFDHTTIVFRGKVHVKAVLPDGTIKERDFEAPSHFLVRADVEHEIEALVDDTTYWCVYSHRNPQGEICEENQGWSEGYQ